MNVAITLNAEILFKLSNFIWKKKGINCWIFILNSHIWFDWHTSESGTALQYRNRILVYIQISSASLYMYIDWSLREREGVSFSLSASILFVSVVCGIRKCRRTICSLSNSPRVSKNMDLSREMSRLELVKWREFYHSSFKHTTHTIVVTNNYFHYGLIWQENHGNAQHNIPKTQGDTFMHLVYFNKQSKTNRFCRSTNCFSSSTQPFVQHICFYRQQMRDLACNEAVNDMNWWFILPEKALT